MVTRKKKIALVIGAGSVKCAAALGLWRVLEKENIHFNMIVGCSGGSLYATAIAMEFVLQECIENTNGNGLRESTTEQDQIRQSVCFLHQQPDDE